MKNHSMVWKHSGSPKPKKFTQTFHGRKLMATCFFWGGGGGEKKKKGGGDQTRFPFP